MLVDAMTGNACSNSMVRWFNDVLSTCRETTDSGWVRVHAGKLHVSESPKLVPVSSGTNVASLLSESLPLFGLEMANPDDFTVTEVIMHKGGTLKLAWEWHRHLHWWFGDGFTVSERVLARDEIPWDSLKLIGRDSLREMQRTRFYLQRKEVPSGENLAVFVSNLPFNLSQRQYEKILLDILGKGSFKQPASFDLVLNAFEMLFQKTSTRRSVQSITNMVPWW